MKTHVMTEAEARREAYRICDEMQKRMRAMGVITTAHYDTGIELIMEALIRASCSECDETKGPSK
jgi:hypothetical protein